MYAKFIVNDCEGLYNYSQAAMEEYYKRYMEIHGSQHALYPRVKRMDYSDINREDQIMVGVVNDLGDKASGRCSKLVINYVLSEYEPYLRRRLYEGEECFYVNKDSYRKDKAVAILKSDLDSERKLKEIEQILLSELPDATVLEAEPNC